ncbi:hypothetical protein [Streptomyces sp. NPDC058773]
MTISTGAAAPGARGEITVKLGTQRKNDDITAWPLWVGCKKTM